MYLHIGGEKHIFAGKIICILNYKTIADISDIGDYEIIYLSKNEPRSLILCYDGLFKIYLSPIYTRTLVKRLDFVNHHLRRREINDASV